MTPMTPMTPPQIESRAERAPAVHTVPDLGTAYRDARRAYRAAWFTYQAASGADFLPAMDAWIAADREVKRLEPLVVPAWQLAPQRRGA